MRVSDKGMYSMVLEGMHRAQRRIFDANEVVLTGKKINKPSQDPVASAVAKRDNSRIARADATLRAIDMSLPQIESSEAVAGDLSELFVRAREIAISGSTETIGQEERLAMASEVSEMRAQLAVFGNTQVGNTYIFSGYQTDTIPFDTAGNFYGDDNIREVAISPGVRLDGNVSGDRLFGISSGTNLFTSLEDLENSLRANDPDAVRRELDTLDASLSQINEVRSGLGGLMNAFSAAGSLAEKVKIATSERLSRIVEADPIQAYSDLRKASDDLNAAVQIASMLPFHGLGGGG